MGICTVLGAPGAPVPVFVLEYRNEDLEGFAAPPVRAQTWWVSARGGPDWGFQFCSRPTSPIRDSGRHRTVSTLSPPNAKNREGSHTEDPRAKVTGTGQCSRRVCNLFLCRWNPFSFSPPPKLQRCI